MTGGEFSGVILRALRKAMAIKTNHRFLTRMSLGVLITACFLGALDLGLAASPQDIATTATLEAQKSGHQRRQDAQTRVKALLEGKTPEQAAAQVDNQTSISNRTSTSGSSRPSSTLPGAPSVIYPSGIGWNAAVDYTKPNFSQSPNIRKFIDALPGLAQGPAAGDPNINGLGQYIPVAIADNTTYPGTDYYEIAVVDYFQKMSTDLPPTRLRGYVQIETPAIKATGKSKSLLLSSVAINTSAPAGIYAVEKPQYLGPTILCKKDRAVRIKFSNYLPLIANGGSLFLPVDTTIMGAGMGPTMGFNFTTNRAVLHLHGGRTPWISDGTPHQWVTPASEVTPYLRGVSCQNVPDMPDPGPGASTYYYTNGQSARLLFYHDHSWGITRLGVYAGEAAGYLIVDQVEDDLIDGSNYSGGNPAATPILPNLSAAYPSLGPWYRYGIPLVIQDKGFVNDNTTPVLPAGAATLQDAGFPATTSGYVQTPKTATVDPLWGSGPSYAPGMAGGSLWFPHEYLPVENPFDPAPPDMGQYPFGRWDFAAFVVPPAPPLNLTLPTPSIVPEAFVDTMTVNGTAFPYATLPPDVIRFRILNACNDRFLNLQVYKADPLRVNVTNGGSGYTAPVVAFSAPAAGVTATGVATQGVGSVFTITAPGSGYTVAPVVTISPAVGDTTGSGAAATAALGAGGAVASITLTNAGSGYTLAPVVTLSAPPAGGTPATATAALAGVVTGITITNPGSGYTPTTPPTVNITDNGTGTGAKAVAFVGTEVKMVPAAANAAYPTWPIDGREGGVPDPTTQGPPWIQIGTEGGLLALVNVVPQQPVDYEYNRQNIVLGGVTSKCLLLPPAVRADVLLDLSAYKAGDTLIVYNDAPSPMPNFWPLNDYHTDGIDQSGSGGPVIIPPGFGPNTRTVMQIRIAGTKASAFNFHSDAKPGFDRMSSHPGMLRPIETPATDGPSLTALKAAMPKAFAADQDPIIVPQLDYNAAYPTGTNHYAGTVDNYVQGYQTTLNVTGTAQSVSAVRATLAGTGYATAPLVTIVGGGGTGATASAGLNPMGGITLLTGGSGYTSPPAVTIGPPVLPLTPLPLPPGGAVQGIQATAVAIISGGQVTAINIVEPGAGYTDTVNAPVITIAPPTTPGGVAATASGMLPTLNTVGSIVVTGGGSGYTSEPMAFITGGGGMGAQAVALITGSQVMTTKSLTEGFDKDYGRMDVRLGSTPNPLTPSVGAGPVVGIAQYIDPPTEVLDPAVPALWRINHLGVDSHSMHFHLFDVQVVNRIDWTNVIKPPYPEEIGWKDTIRTNPMEDEIVALKPSLTAMKMPFGLPESNRLLDPSSPLGSTANFSPVAPPPGVPAVAQVTNVMTNFGWEYVWHCHLLGHEENDMMRPMVFNVPSTIPAASALSATIVSSQVQLTWTDPTPFNYATGLPVSTLGNPANEIGFIVQRATGTTGAFAQIGTALANATTFTDATVTAGTTYRYRVYSYNAAGNSAFSNVLTVRIIPPPAAPTNAVATVISASQVRLTWTDNANNETGFVVERSDNASAFVQIAAPGPRAGTGNVTYNDTTVTGNTIYVYRVAAVNLGGKSAYAVSNTVTTPTAPAVPAAPTNLAGTATVTGSFASVALTWTDNSNNETGFRMQRAEVATFTGNTLYVYTLPANTTADSNTYLTRGVTYWFRVQAYNAAGNSAWSNVFSITTP